MNGEDIAHRLGDMTAALDAIAFRLKGSGLQRDHAKIAAEIHDVMKLMGGLSTLGFVDYHSLNVARELVKANELKVALEQLRRILARQSGASCL
ncbi:hypothetical protein [Paraburkholderia phenazinium]|jgi:predicted negative regulator of RcsB-dependent stress response|uniref:Hpt domain-containing protein n=1 Tax=Paraburkholderia phenazinium TaxID=60549 RepID=A0A1N6JNB2_9BURK|nr:hypothetical protein [Paraburkholderia phenazinium]SIO45832.1 hypothetical protein SAMN05444168_4714 [Paraburkholderia phenazinium]